MENHLKLNVYRGIIQYLVHSTNYDLMDIGDLAKTSLKKIRAIYYGHPTPLNPLSELQLVKTFYFILEMKFSEHLEQLSRPEKLR